jgi:hypothetical protein
VRFVKFPFEGHTSQANGRAWYWQLNILGGGPIASGEVMDEKPAEEALETARIAALRELKEQLEELNGVEQ